ncbi:hypothetical protein ALC53_11872 [Atta colombica]|uniref:Uncharacterized protein n=1 Tax=Atta colombica TaxID=520822 RepID=A0A195B076_9HYME|nr:hypothetical protein ALC53_11872 [Atta colombica]
MRCVISIKEIKDLTHRSGTQKDPVLQKGTTNRRFLAHRRAWPTEGHGPQGPVTQNNPQKTQSTEELFTTERSGFQKGLRTQYCLIVVYTQIKPVTKGLTLQKGNVLQKGLTHKRAYKRTLCQIWAMKDPCTKACSAEGLGPLKSLAHRKALSQKHIANRTTTEGSCTIERPGLWKLAGFYFKIKSFIFDLIVLSPLDLFQIILGSNPMLRFFKIYRVYNYYYMVESRTIYPNFWRVLNLIHILLLLVL